MDMPKKLLLVLLVALMLPFDGTFGFGLDRREAKDEAESPNITHCFTRICETIIPGDYLGYIFPTKKHLIAFSMVSDLSKRKYSIRNLNPTTLEEVWEITDLDRSTFEVSEKYVAIGANTTGSLKLIDIDNGNIIFEKNLGEYIYSVLLADSQLFVATETKILIYDDFQRLVGELNNDGYWLGACQSNLLYLGKYQTGLKCIDYTTGKLVWANNFKLEGAWGINFIGESIITATQDNELATIDRRTGKFVWKVKFDRNQINLRSISRVMSGNFLFLKCFTDENDLYGVYLACIDLSNGKILWKKDDLNIGFFGIFKVYKNRLYTINKSCLYSQDLNNGNILSKTDLLHNISYFTFNSENCNLIIRLDLGFEIKDSKLCLYKPIIPEFLTYILDKTVFSTLNVDYYMDVKPSIVNGTTYMPAKYLLEPLGGEVSWTQKDKKVTCILKNDTKDITIEMQIGKPTATLNGKQVQIDPNNPKITPIILNGRTMVPLRFLAESLGCKVEWKPDTKEIVVTYQP